MFALDARYRFTRPPLQLEHFAHELRNSNAMPQTAAGHHADEVDVFEFVRHATDENLVCVVASQHLDQVIDFEDAVNAAYQIYEKSVLNQRKYQHIMLIILTFHVKSSVNVICCIRISIRFRNL